MRKAICLAVAISGGCALGAAEKITVPLIPEDASPVRELRISENAYAAVRIPPGEGPFPAVIFLHGGLGHSKMENLRRQSLTGQAQARFLAWGYVTVNATRRDIHHDPQDRGVVEDTVAIVEAVKKLPEVDPESVALYGGSGGGTLALEVAAETDVAAVVAGEPASIIFMGMFTKDDVLRGDETQPVAEQRRRRFANAPLEELYTPALRERTRRKLEKIQCPVLILHGDQHWLKRFNLELLVPEMKALGKQVEVRTFPGAKHSFYWGRNTEPATALKAHREADAFLRKHLKTRPKPVAAVHVRQAPVGSDR